MNTGQYRPPSEHWLAAKTVEARRILGGHSTAQAADLLAWLFGGTDAAALRARMRRADYRPDPPGEQLPLDRQIELLDYQCERLGECVDCEPEQRQEVVRALAPAVGRRTANGHAAQWIFAAAVAEDPSGQEPSTRNTGWRYLRSPIEMATPAVLAGPDSEIVRAARAPLSWVAEYPGHAQAVGALIDTGWETGFTRRGATITLARRALARLEALLPGAWATSRTPQFQADLAANRDWLQAWFWIAALGAELDEDVQYRALSGLAKFDPDNVCGWQQIEHTPDTLRARVSELEQRVAGAHPPPPITREQVEQVPKRWRPHVATRPGERAPFWSAA